MNGALLTSFTISEKEGDEKTGEESASVSPVVDAREQKAEDEDPGCPARYLPVNHFAEIASAALPVVDGRSDEPAYGC